MAASTKVMTCPHCGRRTTSRLVNDVASFGENAYQCEHIRDCGKVITQTSATGWAALATLGLAIFAAKKMTDEA
jgi:hypothetical protein